MKNKSYIFCFVTFIAIFILAFFVGDRLGREDKKIKTDKTNANVVKETENTETDRVATTSSGYFIKAEKGYIIIYNHEGELISNTEISIAHFTEQEKRILENGIYVESAENLFRYLESYTS